MADKKTRYDDQTHTVWVYRDFDQPKALVPSEELKDWVRQRKAGETDEGDVLEAVNYVFDDVQTAEYNHQPLAFSDVGVYVGDLDDHSRYQSAEGEPDFETRKDFGMD